MNMMSSGLQKAAGTRLRNFLSAMTSNPFKGVLTGLGYARAAINENDPDKFEELRLKLVKYEEISDNIEYEIATFLNAVSSEEISERTSLMVKGMYKIIGELESLGDSGESISRILSRKNYQTSVYYMDIISEFEKMGDFMINISQSLYKYMQKA